MKNQLEIMEILRDFYRVSGFRISIHDADCQEIFAYPREGLPFCRAIQQQEKVLQCCRENDADMFRRVQESGVPLLYRCRQGLYEAVAPIYHYGVLSGFLMMGQVRDTDDAQYVRICQNAERLLGDRKRAKAAAAQIPAMEESRMRSYLSIMTVIAEYLTETHRVQARNGNLAVLIEQYLRKNYAHKITLSELSQKFRYCQTSLTRAFYREYGCTIFTFLKQIRLDRAAALLKSSDKPIKEIAAACGIEDQNYFSRMFSQQFGCSPTAYRSGR